MSHPVTCKLCGKIAAWYSSFQCLPHKSTRSGIDIYSCDACGKNYFLDDEHKIIVCKDYKEVMRKIYAMIDEAVMKDDPLKEETGCFHDPLNCKRCNDVIWGALTLAAKQAANEIIREYQERKKERDEAWESFVNYFLVRCTNKLQMMFPSYYVSPMMEEFKKALEKGMKGDSK